VSEAAKQRLVALAGTRLGPRDQAIDGALEGDPGDLAVDFSEPGGNDGSRAIGGQAPDAKRPGVVEVETLTCRKDFGRPLRIVARAVQLKQDHTVAKRRDGEHLGGLVVRAPPWRQAQGESQVRVQEAIVAKNAFRSGALDGHAFDVIQVDLAIPVIR